ASLANVRGASVDAANALVHGIARDATFGREHDLVTAIADRTPDQLFIDVRTVHVGGVEEVDADLDRAVDRRDRFVIVARPVELGHAHAAEPDRRDLKTILAEYASLHDYSSELYLFVEIGDRYRFPKAEIGTSPLPEIRTS